MNFMIFVHGSILTHRLKRLDGNHNIKKVKMLDNFEPGGLMSDYNSRSLMRPRDVFLVVFLMSFSR